MKRLFAAIRINPSEAFLSRYFSLKQQLKNEKIRWVDPENIHITLKFFGETPEHHIPGINAALKEASSSMGPFSITIVNTGIFGSSYNPKVIWFGIDPHKEITTLSNHIFEKLENAGIPKDRQNFVPHLTIARMKFLADKKYFQKVIDAHKEGQIQNEEVNQFHLFESILRPQGPKYALIRSFDLG
jgi:2'-5' RNA ligase